MNSLNKYLSPFKRSLKLMISRAVVSIVSDAFKRQNLQVAIYDDEVVDDVERWQNYGHSSVPRAGEAIVLSVGGKRSHLAAIVVDDKEARPINLKPGDSVLYHFEGHQLLLTENGEAILICKKFTVQASDSVLFDTPQTQFTGDVDIVGVSSAADHKSGSVSGKDHTHSGVESGNKETGKPNDRFSTHVD